MTSDVVRRLTRDEPAVLVVLEARQHAAHVLVLTLLLVLNLVDQRDAALLLFLLLALRLRAKQASRDDRCKTRFTHGVLQGRTAHTSLER